MCKKHIKEDDIVGIPRTTVLDDQIVNESNKLHSHLECILLWRRSSSQVKKKISKIYKDQHVDHDDNFSTNRRKRARVVSSNSNEMNRISKQHRKLKRRKKNSK